MNPAGQLLVFTDLDGTLLDAKTHEWREAADTLNELRRRKIPLILCTSKTVAEVEVIRRRLGTQDPYIAENGGMLVLPWSFLGRPGEPGSIHHPYMVRLGWRYPEVVAVLKRLARVAKVRVRGFNEMTDKEIADATGLGLPEARQAKQRQASEPFRFVDATPAQIRAFRQAAKADGLKLPREAASGTCPPARIRAERLSCYCSFTNCSRECLFKRSRWAIPASICPCCVASNCPCSCRERAVNSMQRWCEPYPLSFA